MTFKAEIIGLETNGDTVTVRAQATLRRAAEWRRLEPLTFVVPEYKAKHFRIGQAVSVRIELGR